MKSLKMLLTFIVGFNLTVNAKTYSDYNPEIAKQQSYTQSTSTAQTIDFKVTTLNTEWLSCSQQDPADDKLQVNNIAKLIATIDPDIIALQEVGTSATYATIDTLVRRLGSLWAGNIVPWSNKNCDQNQGIIYKKSKIQLVSSALVTNGGTYSNWSSGRYPAQYNLNFLAGDSVIPVSLINIHAKAMSDATSYSRRKAASSGIKSLLDGSSYNTKRIILIGDFNDYLTGTQCSSCSPAESPYKNFVDDSGNYKGLTAGLYDPYYQSPVIDNVIISNELFDNFVTGSATRETTSINKITNYYTTTTDHTPVSVLFRITLKTTTDSTLPQGTENIFVYPNPISNELFISNTEAVQSLTVTDLSGAELLTVTHPSTKTDVSGLHCGIYIISLKTAKGSYHYKIVKQ
jgi:endonuclease/exonuclease/phosphatase family metal-dependent hydrolase